MRFGPDKLDRVTIEYVAKTLNISESIIRRHLRIFAGRTGENSTYTDNGKDFFITEEALLDLTEAFHYEPDKFGNEV